MLVQDLDCLAHLVARAHDRIQKQHLETHEEAYEETHEEEEAVDEEKQTMEEVEDLHWR